MKIHYYWCVTDFRTRDGVLLPSKYKYYFKLGDCLYISKDGYLTKRKGADCFFPIKYGKNISIKEYYKLANKLLNLMILKIYCYDQN